MLISKKVRSLFGALSKIYKYNILDILRPSSPTLLKVFITARCNFRCQTCIVWRKLFQEKQELKFSDWQRVMTDPIFSSIEALNITGGEPFLYPELRELINLYLESMPKLKILSINTNGFFTSKIISLVKDLYPILKKRGIKFIICVSLDGIGETHDYLRGFPGAFHNVEETILKLKSLQEENDFIFMVNCVISRKNLYEVDKIIKWCKERGVEIRFNPIVFCKEYLSIIGIDKKIELDFTEDDKKYLLKLFKKLSLFRSFKNPISYYYYDMFRLYEGNNHRTTLCRFLTDGFVMNCFGEIYYCQMFNNIGKVLGSSSIKDIYFNLDNLAYRRQMKKTFCRNCNSSCLCEQGIIKNFLRFFWFNLSGKL